MPVADSWKMFDNSGIGGPRLIAGQKPGAARVVYDDAAWRRLEEARPGLRPRIRDRPRSGLVTTTRSCSRCRRQYARRLGSTDGPGIRSLFGAMGAWS